MAAQPVAVTGYTAFTQNQRQEVRDLHNIAGALTASSSGNQQTFVVCHQHQTKSDAEQVYCLNDQGGSRMDVSRNVTGTLRASMGTMPPVVLTTPQLYENHRMDARYTGPLDVSPTLQASGGTGGNNLPLVHSPVYCIAGNVINRQPQNGGNGNGFQADLAYTLTATDKHCVCEALSRENEPIDLPLDVVQTNRIRRLLPLECERLQGFPDNWTAGGSDSARYKALGNSVAIPCVAYILKGAVAALTEAFRNRPEVMP